MQVMETHEMHSQGGNSGARRRRLELAPTSTISQDMPASPYHRDFCTQQGTAHAFIRPGRRLVAGHVSDLGSLRQP